MLQIHREIQYVVFGMKMNTYMRLQSEDSDDNISPVNQNGHCVYILPTLPPMGGQVGTMYLNFLGSVGTLYLTSHHVGGNAGKLYPHCPG